MTDRPASLTPPPAGYTDWLAELKTRIHSAQQRATLAVNRELVLLYWQIGRDILDRQGREGWGAKVIDRLAHDLRTAFPDMKGFSPRNLKYMRAFAQAWPEAEFVQQAAARLPWFHLCTLIDKLKTRDLRDWYLAQAMVHNWSRNVLEMQIETRLHMRSGQAVTNFAERLPAPLSGLARESLPAELQTGLPSNEQIKQEPAGRHHRLQLDEDTPCAYCTTSRSRTSSASAKNSALSWSTPPY
jgi:predicted nuclease of restriction endonuclease-like (RecB) superfamily